MAIVKPTIVGLTIDRRDHVLIGRLSFFSVAASTFFIKCKSMNGPFLSDLGKIDSSLLSSQARYFLPRRLTTKLSVRLFLRVL